jgi:hypothetical protein
VGESGEVERQQWKCMLKKREVYTQGEGVDKHVVIERQ